jgi:hypothetical protein
VINPKLDKRTIFVIFIFIVLFGVGFFLTEQSLEKSFFILFSLLLWLLIFLLKRDLVLASLLYILIVLPFNITLQVPGSVEIFNTEILLSSPFVSGIYVNYLVPTISILDIGLTLFLLSVTLERGFKFYTNILRDWRNGVLILIVFLILQNIFLNNFLAVLNSVRLVGVILSIYSTITIFKGRYLKYFISALGVIFIVNTVIQGIIGIKQFLGGSSLGLLFLGESQVVSGMQGSSFIELGGQLFLRAYGTFPHPNVLAGYLILSVVIGIILWRENRFISVLLILLSSVSLIFTFSRICILLLFLICAIFILKSLFKGREIFFSFSPLLFLERFTNVFVGGDSGWQDRINLLRSSWEVVKRNWFLGVGIGNYVKAMEDFVPRTKKGILLTQPVHNVLMLILSEIGVIGLMIYIYTFLSLIILNVKRWNYLKILVLLSILIIGSFDHYLFSLPQGLIIFLLFIVIVCMDLESLYENE